VEDAEHPVGHFIVRPGRRAHTQTYARKLVGAQILDDAFQPVVTSGGAGRAHPQLAHGQGNFIGYHDDMLRRELIKIHSLYHGFPGKIHKGLGLHKHDLFAAHGAHAGESLEAQSVDLCAEFFRALVPGHEAGVVPCAGKTGPGIAQKYDEPCYSARSA